VFLLNSCLSLFAAAAFRRHPLSRSYGAILPSSLTMLLPSALGSSPHPPVSVCGTGTEQTIAAFLGTWLTRFPTSISVRITPSRLQDGFANPDGTSLARGFPFRARALHIRPHSSVALQCRNFSLLSIGYGFRPRLRSRLTQGRSALPWKPRIFGREDSHLPLATHSGILSSIHSTAPSGTASPRIQCSSTNAFRHS
jgi:hypothetical protein